MADAPADFMEAQLAAIVAFRIDVTRIDAKSKLSQNRAAEDFDAVRQELGAQKRSRPPHEQDRSRGSEIVIDDAVAVERQEDQIDPFQLTLGMKPGAIGPDQAEWKADKHRQRVPVSNDGDGAENAEPKGNPFQLVFVFCKLNQCHEVSFSGFHLAADYAR